MTALACMRHLDGQRPAGRVRALLLGLVTLAVILPGVGCGGGDGGDSGFTPAPSNASFTASGTAAAADLVRIREVASTGNIVTVDVAISGPTTSSGLYSFAFDLVLSDPAVARYVGPPLFGTALSVTGGQGSSALATQSGDRVAVGVTKTSGGAGNGIGAGEAAIVSLTFEVMQAGTTQLTIEGSPANPQNPTNDPAALDETGAVIGSVTFDAAPATITGS